MGYLICILLYIAGIIIYGIVMGKKKVKTSDDFVVAGRQLPFMILIGTLLASWCGACPFRYGSAAPGHPLY